MVASAASPLPAALRLAVLATLLLACSAFSGLGPAAAGLAARRTASPAFASASPVARSRATTRSLTLAAGKEANGEGRTRAQQVLAAVPWKPLVGSASVVATASLLAILVDPPLALVPFAVAGLLYPFGKRGRLSSVPDIFRRKRARKPLIVGNWKLNPTSISECQSLASLVAVEVASLAVDKPERDVEVAIIPPAPFLTVAGRAVDGSGIRLGAQNVYEASSGAFTGEWSGEMLHSLGCSYVLVGHSERRSIFGETDNVVAKKIRAALKAGLTPILCIGETQQEYEEGLTQSVTAVQAQKVLFGLSEEEILRCVIAYEPVWAIGTGLSASPAVIESVHHQIRSELRSRHGKRVAEGVRILYGGSVTPNNVNEIMACPNVDGCLVGGASLAADQFCRILNYSEDEGAEKKLWATEVVPCRVSQ
jgi:triosephosphate isomerase